MAGLAPGARRARRTRPAAQHSGRVVQAGAAVRTPAASNRAVLRGIQPAVLRSRQKHAFSRAVSPHPLHHPPTDRKAARTVNTSFDFAHPWALVLLPLAVLP